MTHVGIVEEGEVSIVASEGHVDSVDRGRSECLRPPNGKHSSQLSVATKIDIAHSLQITPNSIVGRRDKAVVREINRVEIGQVDDAIRDGSEAISSDLNVLQGLGETHRRGERTNERATSDIKLLEGSQVGEEVIRQRSLKIVSRRNESSQGGELGNGSREGTIPLAVGEISIIEVGSLREIDISSHRLLIRAQVESNQRRDFTKDSGEGAEIGAVKGEQANLLVGEARRDVADGIVFEIELN